MRRVRMALGVFMGLMAAGTVRADDEARIKAVLDRALEAHGGRDRLTRFQGNTFTVQGKVQHSGQDVEFKGSWKSQLPECLRVDVQVPFMGIAFSYSQVFHGDSSWNGLNENVLEMAKPVRAEACEQAWAYNLARLTPLTDRDVQLVYLGERKVAGQAAVALAVRRRGRREVKLFFDSQTGLLLKTETKSRDLFDLDQEFVLETFYGDYRKVEGIPAAHKISMQRDGKPYMEMECREHKLAEALGDEVFARP
jgi:hypothetical protein